MRLESGKCVRLPVAGYRLRVTEEMRSGLDVGRHLVEGTISGMLTAWTHASA